MTFINFALDGTAYAVYSDTHGMYSQPAGGRCACHPIRQVPAMTRHESAPSWQRLEQWLDEIKRDLAEIRENTSRTAIAAATLTEKVAGHLERVDIHHVPPCPALDKEVSALKASHSRLLWAALGALAVSAAALLGALWDLVTNASPVKP